jgi:glycosyltransferase involved in cell wall biosynthesis
MKPILNILTLPHFPPSITYRPWAAGGRGFSLLRRLVEQLLPRHDVASLLIACPREFDQLKAEEALEGLGVFAAYCPGSQRVAILRELAQSFPHCDIAAFHLEMIFAPADLLQRASAHHLARRSHFTYVADLPPLLCPEVMDPALLRSLAEAAPDGQLVSLPAAVEALSEMRQRHGGSPGMVVGRFLAGEHYQIPAVTSVSPFSSEEDAVRARQALEDADEGTAFDALRLWPGTRFHPFAYGLGITVPEKKNVRILYLSPGSLYAGAEDGLRGLVEGMGKLGYEQFGVVSYEGVLSERLHAAGCRMIVPNWNFVASRPELHDFAATILDAIRPDFIHCNGDPGTAFLQAAAVRSMPVIAHIRLTEGYENFEEYHAASQLLVADSDFVKMRLVAAGRPADRITVVHECTDVTRFTPRVFDKAAMRRRFELPADGFIVVMVARVTPKKRHDLMVEAFAEIYRDLPAAHLVLVGDYGPPELLQSIHARIDRLGISRAITWLPFQDDIRMMDCAADVVVLPSDEEALGICIIEAMALEIPVVVSDSSGPRELVEDGVSGLVMRAGDAGSLAAALRTLAAGAGLRAEMGRRARSRAVELFSLEMHVRKFDAMLRAYRGATC